MARTASEKVRSRRRGATNGEASAGPVLVSGQTNEIDHAAHVRHTGTLVVRELFRRNAFSAATAVSSAELQQALNWPSREYVDLACQNFESSAFAVLEHKCPHTHAPLGSYYLTWDTGAIKSELAWLDRLIAFAERRRTVLKPLLTSGRDNPIWSVKPEGPSRGRNLRA